MVEHQHADRAGRDEDHALEGATKAGIRPFYCSNFCSALHQEMQGYIEVRPTGSPLAAVQRPTPQQVAEVAAADERADSPRGAAGLAAGRASSEEAVSALLVRTF